MSYQPTLAFAPAGIDACAYWRMWLPHLNLEGSRFSFQQGMAPVNDISECDVVVVQRMMHEQNVNFIRVLREHGIRVIYDLDDNLWVPPKYNPAYSILKTKEVQDGMIACAEWADVITVSTGHLKNAVERNIGWLRNVATKQPIPVVVIENHVDLKLFEMPLWKRDEDKIVIGWGGSNTHSGDLAAVWAMLPDIIEKYDNVYMEFVGHDPPQKLIGHPRVRIRQWCHISEFAKRYATWNWDIVLAPLDNNPFNRSKSNIKMQEAGAIGKPCLAQDFAPYRAFCEKMPELKWLLCDYDWKKKLCELIENKPFRQMMGGLMYSNVVENFSIDKAVPQWIDAAHLALS